MLVVYEQVLLHLETMIYEEIHLSKCLLHYLFFQLYSCKQCVPTTEITIHTYYYYNNYCCKSQSKV